MDSTKTVYAGGLAGLGFGVLWYVWGVYGFWWGVLYGLFWPTWVGFRLAKFFMTGGF